MFFVSNIMQKLFFVNGEYLKKHGMVDMIIERKNLREKLICLMNLLTNTFVNTVNCGSSNRILR